MAVQNVLRIELVDCRELRISDVTPMYSTSTPTGYGAPNPAISDITSYMLYITVPGSTQRRSFNVQSAFPQSAVVISLSDLGLSNEFTTGGYIIESTVTFNSTTNPNSRTITERLIYCKEQCIVKRKWAMLAQKECNCCERCTRQFQQEALTMQSYLNSLIANAQFGRKQNFETLVRKINKYAEFRPCKCM